jgi:hypothetical protein
MGPINFSAGPSRYPIAAALICSPNGTLPFCGTIGVQGLAWWCDALHFGYLLAFDANFSLLTLE